jgi:hypothetical protein
MQARDHNWITLRLLGRQSNRDAIGTKIHLIDSEGKKQFGIVSSTASYLSAQDLRLHFGLNSADGVREIRVDWPSGHRQRLFNSATRQLVQIQEPQVQNPR